MRASHRWLSALTGLDLSPEEMARTFTSVGLEVETVRAYGADLDRVVVAEVRACEPHPKKSGLSLVTVFDGADEQVVVCGAPNVPPPPGRVLLAKLGARLPNGMVMEPRTIAGTPSNGMLCGETELDLGPDDSGLFLVPDEIAAKPGTPAAVALACVDHILEFGLTPNRPDALGHRGLARELCAARGVRFVPQLPDPLPSVGTAGVRVTVEVGDRCGRYAGARLRGVVVGPSRFAERNLLHRLGLRPISNVVDATNLAMLEWGQPVHAFDASRLEGGEIVARFARDGEKLITLDGAELELGGDDLIIADSMRPVALAGVMGGKDSGVSAGTTEIVLECAYFDPRGVRRVAKRHGLHTDSSHRFERGVDPSAAPTVLASLAARVLGSAGGEQVGAAVDVVARPHVPPTIALSLSRLARLVGRSYDSARVASILRSLGCEVSETPEGFACVAPSHRVDLSREADLVEEVARIDGYDNVPTSLARVRPSVEGTPARLRFARTLRYAGAASGLHEAVSFAFTSREELGRCRAPLDVVELENPLTVERSVMRTSLLPGLLAALARAIRGGAEHAGLFELGSSFHPGATPLPEERATFALAIAGMRSAWFGNPRPVDFFDLKGHVESIVRSVTGHEPTFEVPSDGHPALHPRRQARVLLGDVVVGCIGEIHPDVSEAMELESRAHYAELDVERFRAAADALGLRSASGLPRFPALSRDLAVLVDDSIPVATIAATLREAGAPLLEAVQLFDEYRGEGVPAGQRSLAFRLAYRDSDATLTDARVQPVHDAVVAALRARHRAERR